MRICRILTNNALVVLDEKGKEQIVCGKGIGYKKRPGDNVDDKLVETVYVKEGDQSFEQIRRTLEALPEEYLLLAQHIVEAANVSLNMKLNPVILVGKLAALLGLGCALDVLIGDEVIQHDGNVLLVEHAVKACLLKLVDGDRGGDIVAQHDIELGIDELACLDLRQARMCGQNFLRQSHSHNTLSFYFPWSRCPS